MERTRNLPVRELRVVDHRTSVSYPEMDAHEDWGSILNGHPIFTPEDNADNNSLELSVNTLSRVAGDEQITGGRKQLMLIKDADLVVAIGKTIRMTSLTDSRLNGTAKQSYKVCL